MIEKFIDYLQYSILYREQTCLSSGHKQIRGKGFYSRGYIDDLGVTRFFGNPNSKKALVVMSGRALHNHSAVGWDIMNTIETLLTAGANFTRLDIAITEYIEDDLFTMADVESSILSDSVVSSWVKGGSKKIVCIDKEYENPTETVYLGSLKDRGKKGIFRAYDKGAEMDFSHLMISRIEIEDRKEKAHVSVKRLASGSSLSGVFRTRFDCTDEWFNRICDADTVDVSRGKTIIPTNEHEDNEKRWVWLLKQVAPALRKAIEYELSCADNADRINEFIMSAGLHSLPKA